MSDATEIVVYSQPHCAGCVAVERFLKERAVAFAVRGVSTDHRALEEIAERGFISTPVTRVGERWIAGFRKNELERALDGSKP